MAMNRKSVFILSIVSPDKIPSVEVYESMDECVESVRFRMGNPTPEEIERMKQDLLSKRVWADDDGTKYSVREKGGR